MCGIFGCSLKTNGNRRTALLKFKILGLYNIKRGRDASGVFVNGEIKKGIGMISEFDDFIERTQIPIPKENGIMLGHTRQGSFGYKKTLEEAHPFLINENLVFTHNGTIKNTKQLCEKYNLEEKDFSVDSQILGTILDGMGPEVLEHYVGAAALAYTRLDEPNTLYVYHGKSKDFKNGQALEERPLYILETKDGIFYSSLEESLNAIKDSEEEEPYNLKYNTIYKITNGKFILSDAVAVDREEANVGSYSTPVHVGKNMRTSMTQDFSTVTNNRNFNSSVVPIKEYNLIRREALPIRLIQAKEKSGFIYYHMGRYWEAPRKLLQGPIFIKKGGLFGNHDDNISELLFFWEGVLLKGKDSYAEIFRLSNDMTRRNWVRHPNENNFALIMSSFSKHPITNIGAEGFTLSSLYRNQWYYKGATCDYENFTPKHSNGRNYKVEKGHLTKISASQKENVLCETEDLALAEIKALIDGTLLTGTLGGSSQGSGFLLPKRIITEEKEKLIPFYDILFISYNEGVDSINEDEMEALKSFARTMYMRDWNLTATEYEVEKTINDMIKEAVERKCSLMDTIPDNMDKYVLEYRYEEILEKKEKKRQSLQSSLPFKLNEEIILEEITEIMSTEQIDELVETSINDLENLQVASMELMDAQDSDYAQDSAKALIIGVTSTLSALENVLHRHNKIDFERRVKKIRETKSMKDGIL